MMGKFVALLMLMTWAMLGSVEAQARADYALGAGDVVRITVYEHPDLVAEERITESGFITFPLIGAVQLLGKTTIASETILAKKLEDDGFVVRPNVSISILQFHGQQVVVLGQVNRPGKFALEQASRVTDVLALAGGIGLGGADDVIVTRVREGRTERLKIDTKVLFDAVDDTKNVEMTDGDMLYVPRFPQFYIYGEVQRPGMFRLERGMTVVQALAEGGGLTLRGTHKGMRVLRHKPDGTVDKVEVQLTDLLQSDDVIFVKESLF